MYDHGSTRTHATALHTSRQTLQFEPVLGSAQHRQDATGTQSHYTGAFRAVLEKMSRQAQLDIIFVDCSPSCGNAHAQHKKLLASQTQLSSQQGDHIFMLHN